MKQIRLLCQALFWGFSMILIVSRTNALAETVEEMNAWTYRKELDRSSNVSYSLARSPIPKLALYDNLRLELVCKDKKLQFTVDSNILITSQGKVFDFDYRIDEQEPAAIRMKTYPDSKRRGFTDEQVDRIAEGLLSGQSVFIRIHTLIGKVLSAAIPLTDSGGPVRQVLADCGAAIPGQEAGTQPPYGLADFERDFKRLSPEQQRQTLDKMKALMDGFR